jgi:polar amino acid transport system substrate-binding protein
VTLPVDAIALPAAPDAAAIAALVPGDTLRAVINLGNAVLAGRDTTTGEPIGVSVDLARRLGRWLGKPVALTPVTTAAAAVAAVSNGDVDVGFFAIDPGRGADIRFTDAYVLIEGAYLVRNDSPLQENAEVDRTGHHVVVGKGSAYDLFLTREIKAATLVRAASSQAVVDTFLTEGHAVAAGVRQQLEADQQRLPGLRLLPGHFMVIRQAMGLPKVRGDVAGDLLASFVEDAKASGFVKAALARHGIEGAGVAPPAGR